MPKRANMETPKHRTLTLISVMVFGRRFGNTWQLINTMRVLALPIPTLPLPLYSTDLCDTLTLNPGHTNMLLSKMLQ